MFVYQITCHVCLPNNMSCLFTKPTYEHGACGCDTNIDKLSSVVSYQPINNYTIALVPSCLF